MGEVVDVGEAVQGAQPELKVDQHFWVNGNALLTFLLGNTSKTSLPASFSSFWPSIIGTCPELGV